VRILSSQRVKGFVIGANQGEAGNTIWKIRVRDPGSSFDGKKLPVASVRGNIELAKGLNVSFLIGTVDDQEHHPAYRAVDVQLELPSAATTNSTQVKRD